MNYAPTYKIHRIRGITLVEVIIFTVLLSLLIGNMINYLYATHINNLNLMNEVEEAQRGFVATMAVVMLATGTLAFLIATMSAAVLFADSVDRREARIQRGMNDVACRETLSLLIAKDYFLTGDVELSDFDCIIHR